MKRLSLSDRIIRYLKKKGTWEASGNIQRLAMQHGYTAQTAGRLLRKAEEIGLLEVEYRKPHNHAFYRYIKREKIVTRYKVVDNKAVPIQVKVLD